MSVQLEIPDRLLEQLHMSKADLEQEVRLMTAARLYERGLASTERAAEAVGVPRDLLLSRLSSFGVQLGEPEADDLAVGDMLTRIAQLAASDEDYDDDFLRSTEAVVATARELLTQASRTATEAWPQDTIVPIGDGGLGIEWRAGTKCLRLLISPQVEMSYLYWRDADGSWTAPATADGLARQLNWIAQK